MKNIKIISFAFIAVLQINIYSQWVDRSINTAIDLYHVQMTNAQTIYACSPSYDAAYFVKTTDGGLNWTVINTGIANYKVIDFSFLNTFDGYCTGGIPGDTSIVLKTNNGGINWTPVFRVYINNRTFYVIKFVDNNTGWAFSLASILYKTTNGGLNWIQQSVPQSYFYNSACFINNNTGWAASHEVFDDVTNYGVIIKTTNGGNNWDVILGGTNDDYQDIFFIDENTGWVQNNYPGHNFKKTTNGGLNWFSLQPNLPALISKFCFINNNTGWATGAFLNGNHIIKTTDGGSSWNVQSSEIASYLTGINFTDLNTGCAVGENGAVLYTTNSGGNFVGIEQISHNIPSSYILYQNYPNPFNPATKIKFDIPNKSNVKIMVYDILGKEISVLVNEELNPGSFEVNWDASNYPSGVYFYKIVADDFAESKKMILIK